MAYFHSCVTKLVTKEAELAGKERYLLNRNGRFFARLVVPADLRKHLDGKTELRTALGPDRRTALRLLPGAIADLQHRIGIAERKALPLAQRPDARYPLRSTEIAARNYQARLEFDEQLRSTNWRYASIGYVDEQQAKRFKEGTTGKLRDEELLDLVGDRIDRYRRFGNTSAKYGTQEWRELATKLCFSEYEALARAAERDDGDWTGQPEAPFLAVLPIETAEPTPVKLRQLFADYIASRNQVGRGKEAERRWRPVIESLVRFVGHDDARKLTKVDIRNWRDSLLGELSPKTVSTVYLASIRTIFHWAVTNDQLESNVVKDVRQEVPKKVLNREKGYTTEEATKILVAAASSMPKTAASPRHQEAPLNTAAKRWAPFLCAFSGARIVEITQLRAQDFRFENGAFVMRITPDAGTVKSGLYRDVPVHQQLIDMGFQQFVEASEGPLFHIKGSNSDPLRAARTVAASVSRWMHANDLSVSSIAPNHGWRHRFKTVGREAGIADRVLDALTGHASTTAGDSYGDVTVATKVAAIRKLPRYELVSSPTV